MRQRQLALNTEYPSIFEPLQEWIIESQLRRDVRNAYRPGGQPANRDVHVKIHGCVKASFTVHADLPEPCRVGLFREPRSYPAWIRFSSALPTVQDDSVPDHRGMAIKLMGVPGEKLIPEERNLTTLDLILVDEPIFITRTLGEYFLLFALRTLLRISSIRASDMILGGPIDKLSPNAQPLVISSPFAVTYFSQTPYLLGRRAIKFRARPDIPVSAAIPRPPRPDFLREALTEHLASQPMRFLFEVQFQEDPVRQPIENAGVEWLTPFVTVATLEIPVQSCGSAAQLAFGQNLSFNAWRTLADHRPLGSINRARRRIYRHISALRQGLNGLIHVEPTGDETF